MNPSTVAVYATFVIICCAIRDISIRYVAYNATFRLNRDERTRERTQESTNEPTNSTNEPTNSTNEPKESTNEPDNLRTNPSGQIVAGRPKTGLVAMTCRVHARSFPARPPTNEPGTPNSAKRPRRRLTARPFSAIFPICGHERRGGMRLPFIVRAPMRATT
jgi:cytoskeletal protein RodZ